MSDSVGRCGSQVRVSCVFLTAAPCAAAAFDRSPEYRLRTMGSTCSGQILDDSSGRLDGCAGATSGHRPTPRTRSTRYGRPTTWQPIVESRLPVGAAPDGPAVRWRSWRSGAASSRRTLSAGSVVRIGATQSRRRGSDAGSSASDRDRQAGTELIHCRPTCGTPNRRSRALGAAITGHNYRTPLTRRSVRPRHGPPSEPEAS